MDRQHHRQRAGAASQDVPGVLAAPSQASQTTSQNQTPVPGLGMTPDQIVGQLSGMGIPDINGGAETFYENEALAGNAQGYKPFAGFNLPNAQAGDFMRLMSLADSFASFAGYSHMPSPQKLLSLAEDPSFNTYSDQDIFLRFSNWSGTGATMPWAGMGLSVNDWNAKFQQYNQYAMDMTGVASWDAAGLDSDLLSNAIKNGWSESYLNQLVAQRHPAQYGYLAHGFNYQTWQDYKSQNANALTMRYGTGYTNAQALSNYLNPLQQFQASTGAVQQQSEQQTQRLSGRQSEVR